MFHSCLTSGIALGVWRIAAFLAISVLCLPLNACRVSAQELADLSFLDVVPDSFDENLLKELDAALTEYAATALIIGDHSVHCQGVLVQTGLRNQVPTRQTPFEFFGYVQQSRQRVRWVARRPATRMSGNLDYSQVKVEIDLLRQLPKSRIWYDGSEQLPSTTIEDRERKISGLTNVFTFFHPLTVSTKGMGGLGVSWSRGGKVVIDKARKKYLSDIWQEGSKIKAVWHVPVGEEYARNENWYDKEYGGMPVFHESKRVMVNHGVEVFLGKTEVKWELSDLGEWLPTKIRMQQYKGGKKDPSAVREAIFDCEFKTNLDKTVFEEAFRLIPEDADRPVWTEALQSTLGDSLRISPDRAIGERDRKLQQAQAK